MTRRRHHGPASTPERGSFSEWTRHLEAGISSLASTPVSLVMRHGVPSIEEFASEDTLVELLLDHGVHGVPVVDHAGYLVGFVSTTDVVRARHDDGDGEVQVAEGKARELSALGRGFHEERPPRLVREIMTAVAVDLLEHASLAKAAMLMATYRVHQVPVVTESGRVLGMITASDILSWLYEHRDVNRRRQAPKEQH